MLGVFEVGPSFRAQFFSMMLKLFQIHVICESANEYSHFAAHQYASK